MQQRMPTMDRAKLDRDIALAEKRLSLLRTELDELKKIRADAFLYEKVANNVPNRGSLGRSISEARILYELRISARPMTAKELFEKLDNAHRRIKYSTLRSHLTRLKSKGVIAGTAGTPTRWTDTTSQ